MKKNNKLTKMAQTKKINLTVPDAVYEVLEELAQCQGRSTANLTAFAVEYFLAVDAPKLYPFTKCLEKRDLNERLGEAKSHP